MACNIFDNNGNRISSSEEFVKNLYEGKLDELIKSKKVDESKFVKKITNESGFKKEYDKLETDEDKVNFVVELARKLVASGLDKTLLKNKIGNILPNVVDKITDEAVGKFLGEKYSYNFLKGITGISKIYDRLKEWSQTTDGLIFKSVSEYDTIDMTNMNSIAESIVNKHLKDGTIDDLFSDIKNKQIDFSDAFRTSMAVMIAKNYAVDYAQAEVNGDVDTAKKLGEYIKYAKERSRLAGQGLSVLSVLNANSWEIFFGKILDDADFNLETQFTSPDGKIDEAGLNKIKEAFANIKETFNDDLDKAKFDFEKDDSDIDNSIKNIKKKRGQKKDTIKSIQLEVKDKLAALKDKWKSDKSNDRRSSLSSGFFGLTDADFKYGYEVVKVLVEAGLKSEKVLRDEIKKAFNGEISDSDTDILMKESDFLIKEKESLKRIIALEKDIAKLNNDIEYIEKNNVIPPKVFVVKNKPKRIISDKEQALIDVKNSLKEEVESKIAALKNEEKESKRIRESEERAKQRKIREESLTYNINKAANNLMNGLSEKTLKENNAAREFAIKLSRNLRQRMPDKARPEAKTTEEKLTNAIADMKFIFENASGRPMQGLLNAAITEVKQNESLTEEQKAKALDDIDKYFGEVFAKPINDKQLDAFIKLKLKDYKNSLITLSGTEREDVINDIISELAKEVGFDEASDLANQIKESFLNTVQKAALKNLNDKLEKLKPKNNIASKADIVKYVNEEVLELINKGALTDAKFQELLLKSIGISTMSAENVLLLAQAAKQLTEYPIGIHRNRHKQAFTNIINKIKAEDKKGGPKKSAISTIFDKADAANLMAGYVELSTQAMLSGVNTVKLGAFATVFKTINQIYLNDYVTKGLKDKDSEVSKFFQVFNRTLSPKSIYERGKAVVKFAQMIKDNAPVSKVLWTQFMSDGFNVFDSDIEANRESNWYSKITSGKQLSKDKNLNLIQKAFAVIKVIPVMSTRLLMSVDILQKVSTTDYYIEHIYYNQLITQDKTEQEILNDMAEFRNKLKLSKQEAYDIAKNEIQEMKDKGLDVEESDVYIRALEILGDNRLMHDVLLETKQQQKIATEQQEVEGSLGVIYNSFSSFKQIPLGELTLRFMRSAANFTNEGLNYTPYGFVRAATKTTLASKFFRDKESQLNIKSKLDREKSTEERYQILSKALFGSAISVMALFGIGNGDDDEEKEKPVLYYTRKLCRIMMPIKVNGQGWAAKGKEFDPRISSNIRKENAMMATRTDFEAGTIEIGWKEFGGPYFKMRTGMLPFGLQIDALGNISDSKRYGKEKVTIFDMAQMLIVQPIYTVIETTVGRLAKGISDQGSSYAVSQLIKPALPGGETVYQDATKYIMAATDRGEQEVLLKDEAKGVEGFMKGMYLQLSKNTPVTWVNNEAYDALGNKIRIDTKKLPLNGLNYILDLMLSLTEKEKKDQWIYNLSRDKGVAIFQPVKLQIPVYFMSNDMVKKFAEVNPNYDLTNTEYAKSISEEYSYLLNKNKDKIIGKKSKESMQEIVNDCHEIAIDNINAKLTKMPTLEQVKFIVDQKILSGNKLIEKGRLNR